MTQTKTMIWYWLYQLASPKSFYRLSGQIAPMLLILSGALFLLGAVWGLWLAPPDYQQGDYVRIMYLHVPAALLSLFAYAFTTFLAVLVLVWRIKLAGVLIRHALAMGAGFTAITLLTGAIWGKPTWGTWWIWDARLTSEFILFFIYLGLIALGNAVSEMERAHRLVAIAVCIGFADLPVIHFSVNWWHTLHQSQSLSMFGEQHIHLSMCWPLLLMLLASIAFFFANVLSRARNDLIWLERHTRWVGALIHAKE